MYCVNAAGCTQRKAQHSTGEGELTWRPDCPGSSRLSLALTAAEPLRCSMGMPSPHSSSSLLSALKSSSMAARRRSACFHMSSCSVGHMSA